MQKIGVIITEDGEAWGGEVGKGKFDTGRFADNCSLEDVEFEPIYAIQGELPKKEEIDSYTGFVLTGSRHSVNDNVPWMHQVEEFVRTLHQQTTDTKPRMFGICFGHQMMAKALGGEVSANTSGKFKFSGEVVRVDDDLRKKEFYTKVLGDRSTFKIMQSHGEEVSKLPEFSTNVGTSDSCTNELLSYGSHMMSTQGHHELTNEKMKGLIKPRLLCRGKMNEEEMEQSIQSLEDVETDLLVKFVISYLTQP